MIKRYDITSEMGQNSFPNRRTFVVASRRLSGIFDVSDRVAVDVSVTNAFDSDYYAFFGSETDVTHATPGVPRQCRATLSARF